MAAASQELSGGIACFADEAFMFSMKISKFAAKTREIGLRPGRESSFFTRLAPFLQRKNH